MPLRSVTATLIKIPQFYAINAPGSDPTFVCSVVSGWVSNPDQVNNLSTVPGAENATRAARGLPAPERGTAVGTRQQQTPDGCPSGVISCVETGPPGGIRTPDLLIRSQSL